MKDFIYFMVGVFIGVLLFNTAYAVLVKHKKTEPIPQEEMTVPDKLPTELTEYDGVKLPENLKEVIL